MTTNSDKLTIFVSWAESLAGGFAEEYKLSIGRLVDEFNVRLVDKYNVEVFFSRDIERGSNWFTSISTKLSESQIGIIFLTPDSLKSSWVQYESGAMFTTQHLGQANVLPLLIGVDREEQDFRKSPFHNINCESFDPQENDSTIKFFKDIIKKILTIKKEINAYWDLEDGITTEAQDLHKKLREKFVNWKKEHKTHLPGIELVDYKESTNQFNNFTGDYIAFNAPLVYEDQGNNQKALQEHINRYRIAKVKADYFYPIFTILDDETLFEWLYTIHGFFNRLKEELDEEGTSLLTFYAPQFRTNPFEFIKKFRYDMGFTFFLGNKSDDSELVCIYMHNRIYSTLTNTNKLVVKKYFVIRNPDDFERHKSFIIDEDLKSPRNKMLQMNLNDFLQYCEHIMNQLENQESESET